MGQEGIIENKPDDVRDEHSVGEERKKSLFARLKNGLTKTREGMTSRVEQLIQYYKNIDEDFYEELEEILITSDVGVKTTLEIIQTLREKVKAAKIGNPEQVKDMLKNIIADILESQDEGLSFEEPTVLLVVGVNGVGKTTTIGKLAYQFVQQSKSVILAAADTFRAAAAEQLEIWGQRAGVPVIRHDEGSDPAAVIFDAIQAAKSRNSELLICDTAGRLHNKRNLMEELKKMKRIIEREAPEAKIEVLLVLDATTGQNAVFQAKVFKDAVDLTGIILTKLDGTAKGGVIVAVKSELNIPIRYIGVGEGLEDLQEFRPYDFVNALF
ncbi:MAG: signal recognition particle-docking protein FtsY [Clostridia bacterium]